MSVSVLGFRVMVMVGVGSGLGCKIYCLGLFTRFVLGLCGVLVLGFRVMVVVRTNSIPKPNHNTNPNTYLTINPKQ